MKEPIGLLMDVLGVYSPSMKEQRLSRLLQERMSSLGFTHVRTDAAGNAIGEIGEGRGRPRLLLCGHMDTVPGALKVEERGQRIYGRGAVDAKSAMCAMLAAASEFHDDDEDDETDVKGDDGLHITLACVTREEGDSLGVNTLIEGARAGEGYDCAVFGEPTGVSRITVGYRGRVETKVAVKTPGGHAAAPWAHSSAVDEAMQFLQRIKAYEQEHTKKDDHYRSVSAALTVIRGGTYSNVVPNSCRMTVDVRIPPGMRAAEVITALRARAEDYARSGSARLTIEFGEPTEPYEAPSDSLPLRAIQRSIIKNLSARPVMTHKTGTGDMNTLAHELKIPCITYGPGDSTLAHTDQESIDVSDYVNSIKVLKGAFAELKTLLLPPPGSNR